jgi:hypothetical protein
MALACAQDGELRCIFDLDPQPGLQFFKNSNESAIVSCLGRVSL